MQKILLSENNNYLLESGKTEDQKYYIKGIFAQADVLNRNQRIYPLPVLQEAMDEYVNKLVKTRRALGELEHPESSSINPERACMLVTSIKQDYSNFLGEATILDTPPGKIVKALLDENVKLGVSTRALGAMSGNTVQPGLEILAVDLVTDPSAPEAFVDAIVESKKDWVIQNGIITEKKIDQYKNIQSKKSVKEAINIIFTDFLNSL